jgi:hypothetical protein
VGIRRVKGGDSETETETRRATTHYWHKGPHENPQAPAGARASGDSTPLACVQGPDPGAGLTERLAPGRKRALGECESGGPGEALG